MASGPSTNNVAAISGVLRITDDYGPEVLDRTLAVAEKAWGRTKETWDGMLLGGIGKFLGEHGDQISDDDLAHRLAKKDPDAHRWRSRVGSLASDGGIHHTGTGSRVMTCYKLITIEWNKGRRKNLIGA